jgi:hypothetical protein
MCVQRWLSTMPNSKRARSARNLIQRSDPSESPYDPQGRLHHALFTLVRLLMLGWLHVRRAGELLKEWKKALLNDELANKAIVTATKSGVKRKAVNVRLYCQDELTSIKFWLLL